MEPKRTCSTDRKIESVIKILSRLAAAKASSKRDIQNLMMVLEKEASGPDFIKKFKTFLNEVYRFTSSLT